jgi:ribosomal protein L29
MKDLIKIKDKDLQKEVENLKEKNRVMAFSASGATSKDSFGRRKNRKQIARILTELNSRNK